MVQAVKSKTNGTNGHATRKAKGKEPAPAPKKTAKSEVENLVGDKVLIKPLASVKPNSWNPNRMTAFERESLKTGLKTDGWLLSQSLLIWGTDEKGVEKNLIIDGEQRWTVAPDAGFKTGPMVFLYGLTEAKAKALTVKMDAKRGKFADEALGTLLREIQFELGVENLGLDLGIQDERLMQLLAEPEIVLPGSDDPPVDMGPSGAGSGLPSSTVRMVQLFLNPETHAEFSEAIRLLANKYGTKNVSDTALEAVRRAVVAATNAG
jgi:hypothetical protein